MSSFPEQLDPATKMVMDYWRSLRIPDEEIEAATNNFADENLLITQSPSSSSSPKLIYKGKLRQEGGHFINIVARKFTNEDVNYVTNDTITSYFLTHKNTLPVIHNCYTNDGVATIFHVVIKKHMANGSLDKHLAGSTLTWIQRLHICVGVANALSYNHNDALENKSLVHGNIKSSKVLLDENWEPKLHDFRLAVHVGKHEVYITSKHSGTLQYMDPAYEKTGGLTHKSDIFSFGVVLFEVLFGRVASIRDEDKWYFASLARLHYEEKTLDDMIDPDLRKQIDLKSLEIFSETAYYCLKEVRSQRPDIVQIVKKLKTALDLQQKYETPEHSIIAAVKATSYNNWKENKVLQTLQSTIIKSVM